MTTTRFRRFAFAALIAAVLLTVFGLRTVTSPKQSAIATDHAVSTDDIPFTDVRVQAPEFMGYNNSIKLTADQETIKRAALSGIRAACCKDFSAYTCCCKCNLSRTVWGLANYLIAEKGYGAEQTAQKVTEWLRFVNPGGFAGDACYTGGCARPFAKDGCGGMNEFQLVL